MGLFCVSSDESTDRFTLAASRSRHKPHCGVHLMVRSPFGTLVWSCSGEGDQRTDQALIGIIPRNNNSRPNPRTDQGGPAQAYRKGSHPAAERGLAPQCSRVAPCMSFQRALKEILLARASGKDYTILQPYTLADRYLLRPPRTVNRHRWAREAPGEFLSCRPPGRWADQSTQARLSGPIRSRWRITSGLPVIRSESPDVS